MPFTYTLKGKIKKTYRDSVECLNKRFPKLDYVYALVLTLLICGIMLASTDLPLWVQNNVKDMSVVFIVVDTIFLGSTLVSVFVLYALSGLTSKNIILLRESIWYRRIYLVFSRAINTFIITIVWMLLVKFSPLLSYGNDFIAIIFLVSLYSVSITFIHLFRCIWVTKNLVEIMLGEYEKEVKSEQ